MTREELEELPMARVTFTYVRRKTEEKIGASIKLGSLLEVPFKKISKDDCFTLVRRGVRADAQQCDTNQTCSANKRKGGFWASSYT